MEKCVSERPVAREAVSQACRHTAANLPINESTPASFPGAPLSLAMSLTASRSEDGPSLASSLPSPVPGDHNDPSHTLPTFTFVMYQLSLLLSSLGLTSTDAFARQQLLAALSNVLGASLHLRQLTPAPLASSPAVQTAPAHPVASSITEPSLSLLPPAPVAVSPVPSYGIRVITPVEPLTAPLRPRHSRRSRKRRVRSCPSSPVPNKRPSPVESTTSITQPELIASANPFAALAVDEHSVVEQAATEDTIASNPYK